MRKIDKVELVKRVNGRWLQVILAIAPYFQEASERPGVHHTCPIHGGRDGFRFYKDADSTGGGVCNSCGNFPDAFALLSWATGRTFRQVLEDVDDVMGGNLVQHQAKPMPVKSDQDIEMEDRIKRLRLNSAYKTSISSQAPGASSIRKYLESRGLSAVSKALRFHPSMSYLSKDKKVRLNFPAILAMVHAPDGTPVTMHRTYLDPKTSLKAPVENPKKIMSFVSTLSIKGAAIRLFPLVDGELAIAEGIETAIAVFEATGTPCWSTITSTIMESFVPPDGVRRLLIFADKDRSGVGFEAAKKLKARIDALGTIECVIMLPPSPIPSDKKGVDWLDEFVNHGKEIFHEIA